MTETADKKLRKLTVIKLDSVHNVLIDAIFQEGCFFLAYRDGNLVAGFSRDAVDEFYITPVAATKGEENGWIKQK